MQYVNSIAMGQISCAGDIGAYRHVTAGYSLYSRRVSCPCKVPSDSQSEDRISCYPVLARLHIRTIARGVKLEAYSNAQKEWKMHTTEENICTIFKPVVHRATIVPCPVTRC